MTDLNTIQLPANLLAELYKNNLVEIDPSTPQVRPSVESKKVVGSDNAPAIQYLGQNQKNVCLLVDYANDVHLPDNQLNFLTNILQACKLNLGDVAIVNCHRQPVSFTAIAEQLSCQFLLIFGLAAPGIGLPDIPAFTIHETGNCQILCAGTVDSLNTASADSKLLKSRLWTCLKQLFGV